MNNETNIINFTRGVPPVDAFPTRQIQECSTSVLDAYSSTILQYRPSQGFIPLREWIGEKYGVSTDNVLVSNGSLQIQVFLSAVLAQSGDVVLVEEPSYDRAITAYRKNDLEVIGVPLEDDGFNLEVLEMLVVEKKPKFFYIIPDFQNPSGIVTSKAKRESLVNLAEEYNFYILEDNPYKELRYWGEDIPSIYSSGSEKVFFFSSFSKVLSPGLRVGYVVGPVEAIKQAAKIAEDTYITPSMLSQGIVYEFCRRGWLEPGIERLRDLYRPKLVTLISSLEENLPEARWTKPDGGFFVGVYLPQGINMSDIRSRGLDVGLKLSDGAGFYADGSGDSFLRLPFCALSENEIEEGIRRLGLLMG